MIFSDDLKRQFAAKSLKEPNEYKVAFELVPNVGDALCIANTFPRDPVVQAEKLRLISEVGPKGCLASKEDQAKAVYTIAESPATDAETRLKAHRLYAEIMSHIERPQIAGVNVAVQQHNVMVIREQGSDDEWERKAISYQDKLIADGSQVN